MIARDRYLTPAQHSTIAEPDSFAWGTRSLRRSSRGASVDGGAVNTGWATSRDGGRTWRSGVLPSLTQASVPAGPWDRASDPVVAYDFVHGTWLITSLALRPTNAAAVVVSSSPDGLTWSAPVTVVEAPGGRTSCSTRSGSSATTAPRARTAAAVTSPTATSAPSGSSSRPPATAASTLGRPGGRTGQHGPRIDHRAVGARSAACRPTGRRRDRAVLRREPGRRDSVGRRPDDRSPPP